MSVSPITVLKLQQLKPCEVTSSVVSRLPEGCTEDVLQFNVSIPTKLWKVIVDRQATAVVDGDSDRGYTSVMLLPARDIRDLSVSVGTLRWLSRHLAGIHCLQNAVLVNPISEEFSRYGLATTYLTVSFDYTGNFNLGVMLKGLTGSDAGRVIFDARCLSTISMRPTALAVSYIINI